MELNEIERLLELMREHDLVEIELEDPEKGTRLRFKKAVPQMNSHPVLAPTNVMPGMTESQVAVPVPAPAAPEAREAHPSNLEEVPSPMVGTFYRSPSPDADSFVEVGDQIGAESVICIIEAMKVMNEIKADVAGEVVEILVQNGEAVEYGQPLFLVRTG